MLILYNILGLLLTWGLSNIWEETISKNKYFTISVTENLKLHKFHFSSTKLMSKTKPTLKWTQHLENFTDYKDILVSNTGTIFTVRNIIYKYMSLYLNPILSLHKHNRKCVWDGKMAYNPTIWVHFIFICDYSKCLLLKNSY